MSQQCSLEKKDFKNIDKMKAEIKVIAEDYQKNINNFLSLSMPENEKKLAEEFSAKAKIAAETRTKFTEALAKNNTVESGKYLNQYIEDFNAAGAVLDKLVDIQMIEGKKIQEMQNRNIRQTNYLILIILVYLSV